MLNNTLYRRIFGSVRDADSEVFTVTQEANGYAVWREANDDRFHDGSLTAPVLLKYFGCREDALDYASQLCRQRQTS